MEFKDIENRNDLADFLKISRSKLTYILYIKKVDNYYKSFRIPKKSGGEREINAPTGDLKFVQERLAAELWRYQKKLQDQNSIKTNISHAFEKGKSIISNAKIHKNKKILINVDLEDFFNSFHFGRVCGYFEKNKFFQLPHEVAIILAQLTCYTGCLPQGAPTSPIITNLICQIFDYRILKLSKKYKLDYTRYADDLSFSTNDKNILNNISAFFEELYTEVKKAGFKINEKKTHIQIKDYKQKVTGLVVNNKINIDRMYYKKIRAMANSLYRNGEFYIDGQKGTIHQLDGMFSFVYQIDSYNDNLNKGKTNFRELNGREKQYRKFLFYKYFWANKKPLIVTEGKTDIRYIKSALKKYYKEYPTLIKKEKDGTFTFKISFLKRTKVMSDVLGFVEGADAIKNIYNYFTDEKYNGAPNYKKIFSNISSTRPKFPIIFIFDNELDSKENKPIKSFLAHAKILKKSNDLKENLYIQVDSENHIYLLTNPLINDKIESEIEELFLNEVLLHEIDGKRFILKDRYDKTKYYGKEIFSKYISSNYKEIDFSNFKPILDNIEKIVLSHKIKIS